MRVLLLIFLVFFILVFAGVWRGMQAGILERLSPVSAALQKGFLRLTFPVRLYRKARLLDDELSRVREERNTLLAKLGNLEVVQDENEALRRELGIAQEFRQIGRIAARILLEDPTLLANNVLIDQGEAEGVRVGMPVAAPGEVLYGIVENVEAHSAIVRRLRDPSSRIAAHIPGKGIEGVIRPDITGAVWFDLLPENPELAAGEPVLTLGLSGALPEGLLIGTTEGSLETSSGLFRRIRIRLAQEKRPAMLFVLSL
ncbi:rod shape-determining protein MreC [Candidatus Azambacteria bacterium]|nr:rod shape-determining protein MreC [Candidatus Azambacteria bacterium]